MKKFKPDLINVGGRKSERPRPRFERVDEYKSLLQEYPHAIPIVMRCIEWCKKQGVGKPKVEGDVYVEMFDDNDLGEGPFAWYFKVIIGDRSYFIKEQSPSKREDYAVREVLGTKRAKEILQEKGIRNVRVIEVLAGYSSRDKDIFMSRWIDHGFVKLSRHKGGLLEERAIARRMEELEKALSGYYDLDDYNIFYNPKTKEMILFDLITTDIR